RAGDAGEDERQRHGRSGIGRGLLAGEHEDADTDDAAQSDRGQLPQAEDAAEIAALADFGLQLLDTLVAGQLLDQAHCVPRKIVWLFMVTRSYRSRRVSLQARALEGTPASCRRRATACRPRENR